MQIAYRSMLFLLAIAVWLLTTLQILSDLGYFLKTGLYNSGPLFYPPRRPALFATVAGAACIAFATTAKHAWLRSLAAVIAAGILGAFAMLFAIYFWIYADLIAAKFWGPQLNRMMVLTLAFEMAVLAIMYLIVTKLFPLRREASAFYAVIATFSSAGLAKAVLLATAPSIPIPGLAQLTCNGPCL